MFDDQVLERPANSYQYHGFTVFDAVGAPIKGQFLAFTATVVGSNSGSVGGPIQGTLDQHGRGVFGYFASLQGIDTLVVNVGHAVGHAERTYSTPSTVGLVEPAFRIEFDENHTLRPTSSYQYHGFNIYNAENQPLRGFEEWVVVVSGINGPQTFTGMTDSSGRGVFGYFAGSTQGMDTLTVQADTATGSATRAYEPSDGATPGVFDVAITELSDPLQEPLDLVDAGLVPGPGTIFNRHFTSATENSDGVDSFFKYHGDHDWNGGHSADLDLSNGWQKFMLNSTADLDFTVATRARGDVGMARQYSLQAGNQYAFSAYARVRLTNISRQVREDIKARITIHKVVNGRTVSECNSDRFASGEWLHLKIYNCGLSGGATSVRANVRLNAAAQDPVTRDGRPKGTGTLQADWFRFERECVPVGSCPLTSGGTLAESVL